MPLAQTETLASGPVRVGDALLVKVRRVNPSYDVLETESGEQVRLEPGDAIVGVAGARQALRGFTGEAPREAREGDRLQLLNMGGVLGHASGGLLDLGAPTEVDVIARLGRHGLPLNIASNAIPGRSALSSGSPVVAVVGTSMSAGKTRAAAEIVSGAASSGLRVAAVKLTGVACLRDLVRLKQRGALEALSFVDAGLPSTVGDRRVSAAARGLVHFLDRLVPDLIVAEMGDGLLGPYGVESLLRDRALGSRIAAVVLSAADHVGAWGGQQLLHGWGYRVDLITGPLTDSFEARQFAEERLGVPARNALTEGEHLFPLIQKALVS